ncbi:MAG TPA: rRNA maturation RNAse YbeY, partial [Candidatus Cybelea sp.]|nr:rRNA maturation RNAse YbeY [Candidatus Cybelea sp.]
MRLVRFFVRQRAVSLERTLWRRLARCLLEELLARQDYELGVHFIGAAEMARLNETFLGHAGSTDVITFNHQETPSQSYLKFGRRGSAALPKDGRAALP